MDRPDVRLTGLVVSALVAFAGNSLLCRAALGAGRIDAATFTMVRLGAGAAALLVLLRVRGAGSPRPSAGSLARALSLFAYAILFSWAYVRMSAGVGALLLFASVQLTMLGWALFAGGGLRGREQAGVVVALAGLAFLLLPGASAPDILGASLMVASGVAWGAYSLLGRRAVSPIAMTAASFLGAAALSLVPFAAAGLLGEVRADGVGIALAATSGAVTSGLGYAIWYAALPRLGATRAAVVQLAVPVLAAAGGVALLDERLTVRLAVASVAVLAGIALALSTPRRR